MWANSTGSSFGRALRALRPRAWNGIAVLAVAGCYLLPNSSAEENVAPLRFHHGWGTTDDLAKPLSRLSGRETASSQPVPSVPAINEPTNQTADRTARFGRVTTFPNLNMGDDWPVARMVIRMERAEKQTSQLPVHAPPAHSVLRVRSITEGVDEVAPVQIVLRTPVQASPHPVRQAAAWQARGKSSSIQIRRTLHAEPTDSPRRR